MALTVVSKSQSVYASGTPTANFSDSVIPMKFAPKHIKIACESGDVAFSLNGGGTTDGVVKDGETLTFDGMEAAKLAFKISASAPDIRVWAY